MNGIREIIKLKISGTVIDEAEEYKYLGMTIKGGPNGGFKRREDIMKEANCVLG